MPRRTGGGTAAGPGARWPDLSAHDLQATIGTLHLFAQVVGKVRLRLTPWENHGWHVPLYVAARGLTTGLIPVPGRALSIDFDLMDAELRLSNTDGAVERIALAPQSLAAFYEQVLAALGGLGVVVRIDPTPAELPDAPPFDRDDAARAFDPEAARDYWRALIEVHRVFQMFRTRFVGKCSPVHLFWGAFDLAVTRFSGRPAPRHPGGAPNLPDVVTREAYCREVSSAGFWPNPGGADGPSFYSYAYPTPAGFGERVVRPARARFDPRPGEFLLPYAAVREADDPDVALLDFLQSTYEAAADLAGWDRDGLEREQGALGRPPTEAEMRGGRGAGRA